MDENKLNALIRKNLVQCHIVENAEIVSLHPLIKELVAVDYPFSLSKDIPQYCNEYVNYFIRSVRDLRDRNDVKRALSLYPYVVEMENIVDHDLSEGINLPHHYVLLLHIGDLFSMIHMHRFGLDCYLQAYTISMEIGIHGVEAYDVLNRLGVAYSENGIMDKSIEFKEKSLESIHGKDVPASLVLHAEMNLATSYDRIGRKAEC